MIVEIFKEVGDRKISNSRFRFHCTEFQAFDLLGCFKSAKSSVKTAQFKGRIGSPTNGYKSPCIYT